MNKFVQVLNIKQNNAFKKQNLRALLLNEYGFSNSTIAAVTSNKSSSDFIYSRRLQQQQQYLLNHRELLPIYHKNTSVKAGQFIRQYATLVGVN